MKSSDVVKTPQFHLTVSSLRQFCQLLERVDLCRLDAVLADLEREDPRLFKAMGQDIRIIRECHNLLHALQDKEPDRVPAARHQEVH